MRSKLEMRKKYLEMALSSNHFRGNIFYREYSDARAYNDLTAVVITRALNVYAQSVVITNFSATVIIDGLNDASRHKTSKILRRSGIRGKVRGIKDESSAFIRLADTVTGLARDRLGLNKEMSDIAARLIKRDIITVL
jgi:hypothetical protein